MTYRWRLTFCWWPLTSHYALWPYWHQTLWPWRGCRVPPGLRTLRQLGVLLWMKIHQWRQSIVQKVNSDLRIYCHFVLNRSDTIYGLNRETACLILWFNSHTEKEIEVFYVKSWNICTYSVYLKSTKELNCNRFVDPNILASYIRIYESIEFRSFSLTEITTQSTPVISFIYLCASTFIILTLPLNASTTSRKYKS